MTIRKPMTKEWFEGRVIPDTNGGCWLWPGARSKSGYGMIIRAEGNKRAHRAAWELYRGPIPDGMQVCHRCDVRACVNPDHLWLGTHMENMNDCRNKGRFAYGVRSGTAILEEGVVREIARRLRAGDRKSDISRDTGVRYHNVDAISSGFTWAWLTGFSRKYGPYPKTAGASR